LDRDIGSKVDLLSLTSNNKEEKAGKSQALVVQPHRLKYNTSRGSGVQNTPDEDSDKKVKTEGGLPI